MTDKIKKRLFFGAEIIAPWPQEYPKGRVIEESSRHLTLAFLGTLPFEPLKEILTSLPSPSFEIGLVGISEKLLTLPSSHPRVIACHVKWLEHEEKLVAFHKELITWLLSHHYSVQDRELLSHVTLARAPFDREEWNDFPLPLSFVLCAFHLYESLGNLSYSPIWSYALLPPFEEIEHTADLAFHLRGKTVQEIHLHARSALAFQFPSLLPYLFIDPLQDSLEEIIIQLNADILKADAEIGSPLKAVSFHGELLKDEKELLRWEMILDV